MGESERKRGTEGEKKLTVLIAAAEREREGVLGGLFHVSFHIDKHTQAHTRLTCLFDWMLVS